MKIQQKRTTIAIIAVAIGCSMTGCQSFQEKMPKVSKDSLTFWKKKEITDGSNAQKMITLWSENVAYGAQFGAKRGLGGRIYFYDKDQKPAKVEGELVVYAYDDDKDPDGTEPARKYVFSKEEFSQFYSESEFGPSYSVWLPWDDVGNPEQSISLVPIFKTESGNLIRGELSRSLLPGKSDRKMRDQTTTREMARHQASRSDIRRVSFSEDSESDAGDAGTSRKGLRRTSIPMPGTMKQRIMEQAKESGEIDPRFQELDSQKRTPSVAQTSWEESAEASPSESLSAENASSRMAKLYHESKRRAGATAPSEFNRSDVVDAATGRSRFLGSQRPIRLRSE